MKVEQEEVIFNNIVTFSLLPKNPVDKFKPTDTTPSVLNCLNWICKNTGAITVTNFDDGAEGQSIKVLGDGFTTVANNAFIKTNTGANKLLVANKVYRFTLFAGVWIEDE